MTSIDHNAPRQASPAAGRHRTRLLSGAIALAAMAATAWAASGPNGGLNLLLPASLVVLAGAGAVAGSVRNRLRGIGSDVPTLRRTPLPSSRPPALDGAEEREPLATPRTPEPPGTAHQEEPALLAGALATCREALVIIDGEGTILKANPSACRLLGVASTEGHDILACFPSPQRDREAAALKQWRSEGHHPFACVERPIELQVGGRLIPVHCLITVMALPNRTLACLSMIDRRFEVQELERLQAAIAELRSAERARTELLGLAGADSASPLADIDRTLEALARNRVDAAQAEMLAAARRSCKVLRHVFDDMVEFSRVAGAAAPLKSLPFDVREQFRASLRSAAARARARNLAFDVSYLTPQRMLLGDLERILRVVSNIVDNAIRFTRQGSVTVTVRTVTPDPDVDDCELWVTVRDTGPGISARDVEQLLADAPRREPAEGGLRQCRELCDVLGGDIAVTSEPGRGSCFTFRLHCKLAFGMSPFAETLPTDDTLAYRLRGRRALVVDPDPAVRQTLVRWLEAEGMEVQGTADAGAAAAGASGRAPDIILLDLETQRSLGPLLQPHAGATPVVGMKAHDGALSRPGLAAGLADCLPKPLLRDDVLHRLARVLEPASGASTRRNGHGPDDLQAHATAAAAWALRPSPRQAGAAVPAGCP